MRISLEHGAGGKKSSDLIGEFREVLRLTGRWKNLEDDSATINIGGGKELAFTTDAFIVDPIFFPGGDIGEIAMCGTINDLAVVGAEPLGVSLSIVMEEGFPASDLRKIIRSINRVSLKTNVPVVTGDTKVTEKGKLDKIEITTAGVGIVRSGARVEDRGAKVGDVVIASGGLGEHGIALLAHRFDYETRVKSDSRPVLEEMRIVGKWLSAAKDPTRGGIAANLNEIAEKSKVKIVIDEKSLPYKKEVIALADLLGIDLFALPSEGRFIATVPEKRAKRTIEKLRRFNREAKVFGRVERGEGVFLRTKLGSSRRVEVPQGKLIPRIC